MLRIYICDFFFSSSLKPKEICPVFTCTLPRRFSSCVFLLLYFLASEVNVAEKLCSLYGPGHHLFFTLYEMGNP